MAQHSCELPHPTPFVLTYLCQTLHGCEPSGPGLIPLFPFTASHKGVLVWDPQVLPQYKQLQKPEPAGGERGWDVISPWRFISEPIQLDPCSRKWSTVSAGWQRAWEVATAFHWEENSFNSSQRAQHPFEEEVGSVLKAPATPVMVSVLASVKVPTTLQLTGQSTGKTLIETDTLSLLTVVSITILIIISNVINASLTSIRLRCTREKSGTQSCVLAILGHRPWGHKAVSVVDVLNLDLPHISELSETEKSGLTSGCFNSQVKIKPLFCATKVQTKVWETTCTTKEPNPLFTVILSLLELCFCEMV